MISAARRGSYSGDVDALEFQPITAEQNCLYGNVYLQSTISPK